MGMNVCWYRVNKDCIVGYLRDCEIFTKYEQSLYEKYKEAFDRDMEDFNRKMDAIDELPFNQQRRACSNIKITQVDEFYSPKELRKWLRLLNSKQASESLSSIVECPQIELRKQYWMVQWVLNRKRKSLVPSPDKEDKGELIPKNDRWDFVLNKRDVSDLLKRLRIVANNPSRFHEQFPVYKELYYGHDRCTKKAMANERKEAVSFDFETFIYHFKYVLKVICHDFSDRYTLMLSVK